MCAAVHVSVCFCLYIEDNGVDGDATAAAAMVVCFCLYTTMRAHSPMFGQMKMNGFLFVF